MKKENLLKRLEMLGFPLLETEEFLDVNATLAEVVKSKNVRLWEGFPVVLVNSVQRGLFNYDAVLRQLKNQQERTTFRKLLLVSLALYKVVNVKFSWTAELFKTAGLKEGEFGKVFRAFRRERNKLLYDSLSPDRLKNTFRNYFREGKAKFSEFASLQEEFGLEYALSQVFSPKQKELFLKKLKGEKLTKTEREYYSRAVRKKVEALANVELHQLAQKLK